MFGEIYNILLGDGGLEESFLGIVGAEFISVFLTLFVLLLPIVFTIAVLWRALK